MLEIQFAGKIDYREKARNEHERTRAIAEAHKQTVERGIRHTVWFTENTYRILPEYIRVNGTPIVTIL